MLHNFFHSTKEYYPGFESFCDLNCIKLILEANNIQYPYLYIDSSMSLTINFNTSVDEYNLELHESTKQRSVIPEYVEKVKKYYYPEDVNPIDIYELNIKRMEELNSPIAVGVDICYLPYNTFEHMNKHAWHTLLVCGSEKHDDAVYAIDWTEPWFYHGLIPKYDFILARNSKNIFNGDIYSGLPIQNYWIEVNSKGWDKTPEELLSIVLNLSLKQYFAPSDSDFGGIVELTSLYHDLQFINESVCNTNESFSSLYRKMIISLKRYNLFKQYLENANKFVKIGNINLVIDDINRNIEIWKVVLILVFKISKVGPNIIINRLLENLSKVINEEKYLGEKINRIYNQLK